MKEPLNIRLLVLHLAKKIYVLLIGAVLGALVFGGGYYLKTYVFAPADIYVATSQLYLTYSKEVKIDNIYINDYTWQTLAGSDACVEEALKELPKGYTPEFLRSVVKAGLESDVRLVTVTVSCENPDEAVLIANAYEKAIAKLADRMEDVTGVQVFDSAKTAVKKGFDDRTLRMSITGAIIGTVAALVLLLFLFSVDDSVYLPETTMLRYNIPTLLCFEKKNMILSSWDEKAAANNLSEVLSGKRKVCLTDVSGESGCSAEEIGPCLEGLKKLTGAADMIHPVDGINQNADVISEIKESDGVILLLKAGGNNGKMAERAMDYLKIHKTDILGFVLYDTDKKGMLKYLSNRK
ncbi:MAG: hypothetical protein IKP92_01350 [Lachnospiraceae bacterium]|nr:hypothetical protein [Lachnospiraceae bacterium]